MKNSSLTFTIFKRSITILFIIFMILYFQVETGINNDLTKKTIITQENIEKFEKDVKNGEYLDLKNYIEDNKVDTSNFVSKAGYTISSKTSKFIGKELGDLFNAISKLFK